MISEPTQRQLAELQVDPNRSLLICDVDDVVVDFLGQFGSFVASQGYNLRPTPKSAHGEIVEVDTQSFIGDQASVSLIDEFFAAHTQNMHPLPGAVASLLDIGKIAQVVFLTNLPHTAGDQRRQNMKSLGLPYPVITNSGPKGPAILHLAGLTKKQTAFIDDSPYFIASAHERAPHVELVHFLHNQDYAAYVPHLDYVGLRASTWTEAHRHLKTYLTT